ncbi:MAG: phosphoglucosamine mutase [Spirulina sp. SIO3F2]|nr:phosphoglucosamine mutase [Spirulina sp. SIO3F2]
MVISPIQRPQTAPPSVSVPTTPSLLGLGAIAAQPELLPKSPLLGTDGIRGQAGVFLSPSLAIEVGYWAGQVLRQQSASLGPIILGQDSRNSSDMLATALASGLTAAGLEVWHVGLCPTPCVSYLTRRTAAIGGVMISASHNPPADNGIKFFGQDGTKLPKAIARQIETGIRGQWSGEMLQGAWGRYHAQPEQVQHYTDALRQTLADITNFRGLKVVLDLAWGAAVHTAPQVFQSLGAQVFSLHTQADGDRINVGCGSTHLQPLQQAVAHYQADLGFAFDGDADRVMAVDAQGRVVDGDYILYLWGQTLMNRGQLPENLLIGTVMANLGFERAWEALGGTLHRTPVGDQHVQAAMFETGAMLGGEQSGHILCHHHGVSGDGLQTALHLTALVKQSGATLAQLRDQSFTTYPQLLRNVRVEDRDRRAHWQDCEPLQSAIAQAEQDLGAAGRVLVRASGTEPVVRVMVEAADAQAAEHWTASLVATAEQHLA